MKRLVLAMAVVSALVVATVIAAGRIGAAPSDRPLPDGRFRLTTQEVLQDQDVLVSRIEVQTHPGTTIRVTSDVPNRGGFTFVKPAAPVRLTIFGDHIRWEAGKVDALKFMMRHQGGAFSNTGPMPAGKTKLSEVLAVTARSGEYPEGDPISVVTFNGTKYSLVVEPTLC